MQRAQRRSAFSRCVGQVLVVPGRRPRIPRGRGKGRKRTDPASDPSAVREGSLLVMCSRLIRGRSHEPHPWYEWSYACRPCSQDRFTEPSSASLLADAAPVLPAEMTVVESEWSGLGETHTSTARGVPRAARPAAKDFLQQTRFSGMPPWVLVGRGKTPAAHPATGPTSTRAVVFASSC